MSKHVAARVVVPDQRQAPDLVSGWVAEGIITDEQADRIRARDGRFLTALAPAPARPSMMPLVVEALGYLGGAIVVVATVLIAQQYWADLGNTVRLGLLGAAALFLLVGGWLVPTRLEDVGTRMRSVVWVVSVAALAGFLGVWGSKVADLHGSDLALVVTGGTAAYAMAMFLARPSALQQLAMMGLIGGTATAALANVVGGDSWPGVGFWVVGVAWIVLGQVGALRPVRLARVAGAVLTLIGSMMTTSNLADPALVFSLLTVTAVVTLAVVLSDLALLAVGSLGAIQAIIAAANEWFPNSLAAAVALLLVGGGLVATAIWIARRRAQGGEGPAVR
jgi:hypothetical protein